MLNTVSIFIAITVMSGNKDYKVYNSCRVQLPAITHTYRKYQMMITLIPTGIFVRVLLIFPPISLLSVLRPIFIPDYVSVLLSFYWWHRAGGCFLHSQPLEEEWHFSTFTKDDSASRAHKPPGPGAFASYCMVHRAPNRHLFCS